MKVWQYVAMLTLGLACVGLSVASVVLSIQTNSTRARVAAQQTQLNGGILGQQGQQIRAGILQDMAAAAAKDEKMRKLLERHGYNVPTPTASNAAARAVGPSAPDGEVR